MRGNEVEFAPGTAVWYSITYCQRDENLILVKVTRQSGYGIVLYGLTSEGQTLPHCYKIDTGYGEPVYMSAHAVRMRE